MKRHAWMILLLALLGVGVRGEGPPGTICQLCGMNAAVSDTEFVLDLQDEDDTHACCINCARRLMKLYELSAARVTTLDYRTRKQVPAAEAFYVLGSRRIPKGSMVPFVFAFALREDADAFRKREGGRVLTFAGVLDEIESGRAGARGH